MGILHVSTELRLLRCTFVASHESGSQAPRDDRNQDVEMDWGFCLQNLVDLIEAGEYFQALVSPGVSALLGRGSPGSFQQGGGESENKAWFNAQKVRIKALVSDQVKLRFSWVF